jgi:hypothetical protein
MSENVQFDEDQNGLANRAHNMANFSQSTGFGQSETPGMAGWLVKKGIIKTEAGAKNFLVGVVIADFIVAAVVIYFFVLK